MINKKITFTLSFSIALLIIISGSISIFTPEFYYKESFNWQVQSIGQDLINIILIAPLLSIISSLIKEKVSTNYWAWAGINLYLIYTYTIYCFSVHFNSLFIIYCIILGLSFYSVLYFIYTCIHVKVIHTVSLKITGIYFISIGLLFYFLWLSDILPAIINNNVPQTLTESGLTTNPVHAIDLSVFLPGLFITGYLILKKNNIGYILAVPLLVFTILMDVTIVLLIIIMKYNGLPGEIFIIIVMGMFAIFSGILLIKQRSNTTNIL